MALMINDNCEVCDACVLECPNDGQRIAEGFARCRARGRPGRRRRGLTLASVRDFTPEGLPNLLVKDIPEDRAEVIVCENNFHGRTTTIVSFSKSGRNTWNLNEVEVIQHADPGNTEDHVCPAENKLEDKP